MVIVKPIHCLLIGIALNIVGVSIIIIGPNLYRNIVNLVQKMIAPHLFYWPYLLAGGASIISGLFFVILGVVTKLLGIEEWEVRRYP